MIRKLKKIVIFNLIKRPLRKTQVRLCDQNRIERVEYELNSSNIKLPV